LFPTNRFSEGILMKTRILLLLPSVLLWPLDAQTVAQPEIMTDRPDITESGVVVPRAALQIENGLTWTLDHGTQTVDLSESLIRFEILDKTEVRFGVPNYSDGMVGSGLRSGFGDLSLGIKQQLGPLPGDVDCQSSLRSAFPRGDRG
jgi:Putative MetA-pathway of phenol degradation